MGKNNRVHIRKTHPLLYWGIMTFALFSVGLAVSYWFGPPPTFNPYDISRDFVASVFFLYGVWQIVFLTTRHLLMVRIGLAFAPLIMGGWGIANSLQAFDRKASFAFPLVFIALGAFHLVMLTEGAVNPFTRRDNP